MQTADRVEDDQLVFELQPSSPRVRAELRESEQHAALNQQLAQEIPRLDSWQQLQQFMQQHGDRLNFLNVVALVAHAAALQQVCACVSGSLLNYMHGSCCSQWHQACLQHKQTHI